MPWWIADTFVAINQFSVEAATFITQTFGVTAKVISWRGRWGWRGRRGRRGTALFDALVAISAVRDVVLAAVATHVAGLCGIALVCDVATVSDCDEEQKESRSTLPFPRHVNTHDHGCRAPLK